MTINARILASGGKEEFHHHPSPTTGGPVILTYTPSQAHGHFKSATLTAANTVVIVQPKASKSIWVTDIIVSGEKQASSDITVQFTDGTDTEIMVVIDQVDSSPNLSINLNSYFRGWKDARVELVTSGAGDATVTIGYLHSKDDTGFDEWSAQR